MLQAMRASAKGLLVKGLIGLLVISFASWGVVDYLGGVAQRPVAVVGDREIGAYEVSEAYRAQLNQLRRRFQGQITPEQAQAFGLHQQVVDQLVNAAAVDEEADALNLAIADESIQTAIVNDPTFQDAQGRFVPDRFTGLLRQVNMSEGAFVSQQRQTMRRRQLTSAVGS
ncbi:MAG: SurA N-terminal domain-containing protein, partial [Pseudomonadota bacterium]